MSPKDLAKVVGLGVEVAERASGGTEFVRLADLLASLNVELISHPLLVEGVVAEPKGGVKVPWKILIDSETHGDVSSKISAETAAKPLGHRLRNTVAHELVHVLVFRTPGLGHGKDGSRKKYVASVEGETERLSALLLVPHRAFRIELDRFDGGLTIERLCVACDRWGVSPPVLVRRFELLPLIADYDLRYHTALQNMAIGIGEWGKNGAPQFNHWWLYSNFSGVVPEYIARLRRKENVAIREVFEDTEFMTNGGRAEVTHVAIPGGTSARPGSERLKVRLSVQMVEAKPQSRFLWLLRREAEEE